MLSIVIPTHQRADLLRACLAAVCRHAPPGTEIIVVDDSWPDEAAAQVAALFPGVHRLRLPRRAGFAAAANAGIRASRGDIIELLNDDTEVRPGWAQAALAGFADPQVGAVAPLTLSWPDGRRIDSAGDGYHRGGFAVKHRHGQSHHQSCDSGPVFGTPVFGTPVFGTPVFGTPVFGASASSAFYRRAALDQAGLFPESFGSYFEDVDLAFRLQRAGWRTVFEPAAQVLHHGGSSHGRSKDRPSRRLVEQQSRNEEWVFWRNLPRRDLLRALPLHLAVLLGKALRRCQEGTIIPWIVGRLRALRSWRQVLQHRRQLSTIGPDACLAQWQVDG